jgi:hypothetical protein
VRQNSSHRLGHRWLLRHIQNSNRSRHLQASSPQNSQPKKNPKKKPPPMHQSQLCNYYIALGDAILSSSALHCSGKCTAHSHPSREIRVRNLQHSSESGVGARVLRCGRSCFALLVYLAGKETIDFRVSISVRSPF